ncbi:MAG TPA: dihydrolipoyl dehydrogenase [Flavobacteriales bacterium]|nr:dihydrolipoyl dehydrogenase [Flavobacteriales bacterium]
MDSFDVAIIGSGPGGYVAAIRCAQLGMKTALIERYATLGGTCLNVGCIPSKAMLDSSEHFYNAGHTFAEHGIQLSNLKADLGQMVKRKNEVVAQTVAGIDFLMKKNKITVLRGHGSFINSTTIRISKDDKSSQDIQAKNIILATGSKPTSVPGVEIDKKRIITSTEALNLKEIPKHLIIIGGGVIGMEMGSVYARLGAEVSVVEYTDSICGAFDGTMRKELQKVLSKLGFKFYLQHKVTSAVSKGKSVSVTAEALKDGAKLELKGDYVLVCTGRRPYTDSLGLENAGLAVDEKGRVPVNENCQTSVSNIYAIGDLVRGAMLAHKAEEEGTFVAEFLAGQKPHINHLLIPNVVYTWPEVASVGYTEEQLKADKRTYKVGSFPFKASGRARASMDTDGVVKMLTDADTDEILGVHIIGPRAADMIAEAVVAMEFRASAEDIARISHAHPTFTESVREAALAATGNRAIHM